MAASSSQGPRRIPGAPPNIFLEGAGSPYSPPSEISVPQQLDLWPTQSTHQHDTSSKTSSLRRGFKTSRKGKEREHAAPLLSPYGEEEFPVFGRPFGFKSSPKADDIGVEEKQPTSPVTKRVQKKKILNPYEDLLAEADDDLDLYAEGKGKLKLTAFGGTSR